MLRSAIKMMMMMMMIIIIIIIGAAGTISKSSRKYPRNLSGKDEIKELQINSHTGHCTHTAGSADVNVQNTEHGK